MIQSTDRCNTCRYFDRYKLDPNAGLCLFNAPGGQRDPGQEYQGGWPVKAHDSWCGQHDKGPEL